MKRIMILFLATAIVAALACLAAGAAEKVINPKPIQIISWLDGRWVKAYGENFMEEHWSSLGGTFMGMCREMKDGESTFIEIMVIEPEGEDTVMRIRHFGPGLRTAWEDKDRTVAFKLGIHDNKSAVFTGMGANEGDRITYKLLNKDILDITTEFMRDGVRKTEVVRMRREA